MQTQPEAPRFHEPALGYDDGLPLFAKIRDFEPL